MPCDSIQLCGVDLSQVTDIDLLQAAMIEEYGSSNVRRYGQILTVNIRGEQVEIRDGQVIVRAGRETLRDEISRAYSRKAVRVAAQRYGWRLAETKPQRAYAVVRRY